MQRNATLQRKRLLPGPAGAGPTARTPLNDPPGPTRPEGGRHLPGSDRIAECSAQNSAGAVYRGLLASDSAWIALRAHTEVPAPGRPRGAIERQRRGSANGGLRTAGWAWLQRLAVVAALHSLPTTTATLQRDPGEALSPISYNKKQPGLGTALDQSVDGRILQEAASNPLRLEWTVTIRAPPFRCPGVRGLGPGSSCAGADRPAGLSSGAPGWSRISRRRRSDHGRRPRAPSRTRGTEAGDQKEHLLGPGQRFTQQHPLLRFPCLDSTTTNPGPSLK
jgi:hypothetical protein